MSETVGELVPEVISSVGESTISAGGRPFLLRCSLIVSGFDSVSTMDAAACGTVGEGDFYWGGLASTLFWVDPVEDLYVIFMTQLIPSSTFNFRGQIKNIVYGALRSGTDY